MKYCHSCDRNYSDTYIRKHYRSDNHLNKTFEFKYVEKHKNILVKDIDSVFLSCLKNICENLNFFSYAKLITENTKVVSNTIKM